jgi:predicted transcriptional regulator
MTKRHTLHIEVSTAEAAMDEFARTWETLEQGIATKPIETLGFETVAELLSTLTPGRWDLIQCLKRRGPSGIEAFAASVGRDATSVHRDIDALAGLGIVERDQLGRLSVPWDEIDLRIPLAA